VDDARARTAFPLIREHVLLGASGDVAAVDAELAAMLSPEVLQEVLAQVPDALLTDPVGGREFASAEEARARYVAYLATRLIAPRAFVAEAAAARERARREPRLPLSARR
jgi:hypothetical protein